MEKMLIVGFMTGFILVAAFIFCIVFVLGKKAREKINKQARIQDFAEYQCFISKPRSLPAKLPFREAKMGGLAVVFGIIWFIFAVVWFMLRDTINILFLVIPSLSIVPFILIFAKNKKRVKTEDELYVFLTKDGFIYKGQMMPYNEIQSIFHTFRRDYRYAEGSKYYHYIEVTGNNGRIDIPIYDLLAEHWSELINCCLYHNPRILIDKVVRDTWVDKKIPLLSAGTFEQERY